MDDLEKLYELACGNELWHPSYSNITFIRIFNSYIYTHLFNTSISWQCMERMTIIIPKKCDQIQHRAIGFFLGEHRYAPILCLQGDMG